MKTNLAVGFVGAGRMGLPMVRRLAAGGAQPRVLSRRPEATAAITAAGGMPVTSIAEFSTVDVVFVCMFSSDQMADVVRREPDGLLGALSPGSLVVSHVTASRSFAESIAADLGQRGIEFVDAPVSGSAEMIAEGRLTVLVGGTEAARARCLPLLATYCSAILPTGAVGTATAVKLINNAVFGANLQIAALATYIAEREGVDPQAAMAALDQCSASSSALTRMLDAGGPAAIAARVRPYLTKDFAALREHAADFGVDLGVIENAIVDGPLIVT